MTWYYDIAADSSEMDVYDHTGTLVKTIQNDGSGFRFPDDVLAVMREEVNTELPEAAEAGNAGNNYGLSQRGGEILRDMAMQDIQKGVP